MAENHLAKANEIIDKLTSTPTGRPTKWTQELESQMIELLQHGATVKRACDILQINPELYYRWVSEEKGFSERIQRAKGLAGFRVEGTVYDQIINRRDMMTARWWLERNFPSEYAPSNQTNNDNRTQNINLFLTDDKLTSRIAELIAGLNRGTDSPASEADDTTR